MVVLNNGWEIDCTGQIVGNEVHVRNLRIPLDQVLLLQGEEQIWVEDLPVVTDAG